MNIQKKSGTIFDPRFRELIEKGQGIVIVNRQRRNLNWRKECETLLDSICYPAKWRESIILIDAFNENVESEKELHPEVAKYIKEKIGGKVERERERAFESNLIFI